MARALPEMVVAALRDAFAGEVAARLPGMRSASAEVLATGAVSAARTLVTHAHTLASSAALVGEPVAARHARHCEELLMSWCSAGSVPPDVAAAAASDVAVVSRLLSPWLAA